MSNKHGFVLIEALFVFMISIMCILILSSCIKIVQRIEQSERYDKT